MPVRHLQQHIRPSKKDSSPILLRMGRYDLFEMANLYFPTVTLTDIPASGAVIAMRSLATKVVGVDEVGECPY